MYLRSRTYRSLDPKGRLMISPDMREVVLRYSPEGKIVLTTYDNCIVAFPYPEWEEFENKLARLRNPSRLLRDFRRLVLGGAEVMVFDAQGRIRLSKDHMLYSGIEREAVIMGQGTRFELWSPERLDGVLRQDFDDVAADISESGIDFGL